MNGFSWGLPPEAVLTVEDVLSCKPVRISMRGGRDIARESPKRICESSVMSKRKFSAGSTSL